MPNTNHSSRIVVVYGQPGCAHCKVVTRQLDKQKTSYKYVDVMEYPEVGQRLRAEGHRSLPVVEVRYPEVCTIESWDGVRPDRIKALAADNDPAPVDNDPAPSE